MAQLDGNDLVLASESAKAQVTAALTQWDLAAAELKRYADLEAKGFISVAEIERRQASLDASYASLPMPMPMPMAWWWAWMQRWAKWWQRARCARSRPAPIRPPAHTK